jgi:hypothetical protein
MDSIRLADHSRTLDGLRQMMEEIDDAAELVQAHVDVSIALLIAEIGRRAEDRPEWFPSGKWATLQHIQASIDRQIGSLFVNDQT